MNDVAPQNLEAEEHVLGAMMISPKACDAVADLLEPADFYRESHSRIYRAALDIHARGVDVDAITLTDELEARGQLEDVGGRVRMHELAALVPATGNVRHYARIVRECATLRGLIQAGNRISDLGWNRPGEVDDLVTKAEEIALGLRRQEHQHDVVFSSKDIVAAFRQKMAKPDTDSEGISSPFPFIKRLRGGRLYVLAGYTADGKTAMGLQFLSEACRAGESVDFATIEMSQADLTDRLVSQFGIPHHMCQSGIIEPGFAGLAEHALTEIESWNIRIIDDEALDVAGIRRYVRAHRPGLLIIDHLHRFEWKERRDLELIIRSLTNIAREYDIPILLLAQLKRTGDWKDPFPRPTLNQLKETSVLEQEAWAVWFVWRKRDEFFQPTPETEFLIAKNRGGGLGWERLEFKPQFVRFDSIGIGGGVR